MRIYNRMAPGFFGDTRASTAPIFGLLFLPMLMIAGAGADYIGVATSKSKLQSAVDAAALAVAAKGAGADAQQIATGYVQNQFPGGPKPTIEMAIAGSVVTVKATIDVPMHVLQFAHVMDTARVSASAKSTIGVGADKPTEIVLAIDATGSMNSAGKITALRTAAKSLLDNVTDSGANPYVKLGLAPFTNRVRLPLKHRGAPWLTDSETRTTLVGEVCKTDYPNAVYGPEVTVKKTCISDGASVDCSFKTKPLISQGQGVETCEKKYQTFRWTGCVGSQNAPGDEKDEIAAGDKVPALTNDNDCPAELTPLGASLEKMKTAIDALKPKGETYIAPGLLWAWRALSPNPPLAAGAPYDKANKIIVLLTDGANTRSFKYPGDSGTDVDAANDKLSKVCKAIKANGVRIFTIAFQVSEKSIKDILVECASSPPYYFDAEDNEKLKTAFQTIGRQVSALRLVQ